jgi:high-affinity iron transporter
LSDDQVWDLVAAAWMREVTPGMWARAGSLYPRDCAACHGAQGRGDGPAGEGLPGLQAMQPTAGESHTGHGGSSSTIPSGPANFTDLSLTLSASDVVLQGKLLRGGMGTGMPEFGSLYTDEELWALVAYVRSFHLGTPAFVVPSPKPRME